MKRQRRLLVIALLATSAGCGGRQPTTSTSTATPAATAGDGNTAIRKQQVDAKPEIERRAASLLEEGRQRAASGDIEGARGKFRDAAGEDPKFAEAWYNIGVLEEWQGRGDGARQAYEQALTARADFGPAVAAIASLLIRAGDAPGALRFAEGQLAKAPESNALRNAVNTVRLAMGRADDVVTDSKQVLRRDEKNVDAMRNLAGAYAHQGKFELAVAILTNALALEPEDPSLLGRMALAHLKLGERPKARAALEKAIALPGGATAEIYNNLGLVYHEAGDFAGAEDLFRKALARWPGMLPARINLGNALKGQQKYAEADAVLRDALQQSPRSADALYNLGILYLDGQIPGMEAVARLERALAYFEQYRQVASSRPAGDPVEQYVAEAQKRIDVETKKAAQARQAPKGPEGGEAKGDGDAAAKDGAAPAQAGVDPGGEEK